MYVLYADEDRTQPLQSDQISVTLAFVIADEQTANYLVNPTVKS